MLITCIYTSLIDSQWQLITNKVSFFFQAIYISLVLQSWLTLKNTFTSQNRPVFYTYIKQHVICMGKIKLYVW